MDNYNNKTEYISEELAEQKKQADQEDVFFTPAEIAAEGVESAGGTEMYDAEAENPEMFRSDAGSDEEAFTVEDEVAASVSATMEQQKELKMQRAVARQKVYRRRRMIAVGIVAGILLVILLALLIKLVGRLFRPATANIGPLPSETVAVSKLPQYYDYTLPVPVSSAVVDYYFNDALLIGDTRVQCLDLYGVSPFGSLLYGSSINVSNAFSYSCKTESGSSASLYDKLSLSPYGKIYLSFGLNELGWSNVDTFANDYRELVKQVKAIQPDATIYLLGQFPVSANKDGKVSYITNERIRTYNNLIAGIANDLGVYYLDCYTGMADEGGCLPSGYTSDGINLLKDGCSAWVNFFKTHTVNPEDYVN